MKLNKLVFILFFLLSCSTTKFNLFDSKKVNNIQSSSLEDLIDGWREMVDTIKKHIHEPAVLKGKSFELKVKLAGDWDIQMQPSQAFKVKKNILTGGHRAEIENPEFLFDKVGGLNKMRYIQAQLIKVGGFQGDIQLDGRSSCLYSVEFLQNQKSLVDLDQLEAAYKLEVLISHPEEIKILSKTKTNYLVQRVGEQDVAVNLKLLLTHKNDKDIIITNPVVLPNCEKSRKGPADSQYVPRTAGQCIVHVQTKGVKVDSGSNPKMELAEEFLNTCHLPVECELKTSYGYVNKESFEFVETKIYPFKVEGFSPIVLNTSWNFKNYTGTYDTKVYTSFPYSKEIVSKGSTLENEKEFLTCQWAN